MWPGEVGRLRSIGIRMPRACDAGASSRHDLSARIGMGFASWSGGLLGAAAVRLSAALPPAAGADEIGPEADLVAEINALRPGTELVLRPGEYQGPYEMAWLRRFIRKPPAMPRPTSTSMAGSGTELASPPPPMSPTPPESSSKSYR